MINEYKYNEKLYAEKILENGFLTKFKNTEMKILVKYWKHVGIKPKEREKLLNEFCVKHIQDFRKELYYKQIKSALNYGKKKQSKLIIIESVDITFTEFDYLNNLHIDYNYKKFMFTAIVFKKISNKISKILYDKDTNNIWFGKTEGQYKELKDSAKIQNKKIYNINNIINILDSIGLLHIESRGQFELSFLKAIPNDDNIKFIITTFDDIGYYFDFYNNCNKIIRCENCGRFIKQKNNKQKYCEKCAKTIDREKAKVRMKSLRMFDLENPLKP